MKRRHFPSSDLLVSVPETKDPLEKKTTNVAPDAFLMRFRRSRRTKGAGLVTAPLAQLSRVQPGRRLRYRRPRDATGRVPVCQRAGLRLAGVGHSSANPTVSG